MAISYRNGWTTTVSAWKQLQAWSTKRAAMVADFQQNATNLSDAVTSASTSQASGLNDLAARAALARVQTAAKSVDKTA